MKTLDHSHHPPCRCAVCRKPEPCVRGVLLPRVIARGQTWHRCCHATLQVEGLPECLHPPLMLASVTAVGEPSWTQQPDPSCRALCLHVIIPVQCEVRDCQGCTMWGRACIEVDITLPLSIPLAECWRSSMKVIPCVRMICPPCTACEPCFDVQLEVLAEAYLLRWETCQALPPKPDCPPPLPLYPPPCK